MDQKLYDILNKDWRTVTRILLGEEIGELKEYEEWLTSFFPRVGRKKSYLSGKDVTLTMNDYCGGGEVHLLR